MRRSFSFRSVFDFWHLSARDDMILKSLFFYLIHVPGLHIIFVLLQVSVEENYTNKTSTKIRDALRKSDSKKPLLYIISQRWVLIRELFVAAREGTSLFTSKTFCQETDCMTSQHSWSLHVLWRLQLPDNAKAWLTDHLPCRKSCNEPHILWSCRWIECRASAFWDAASSVFSSKSVV